MLAEFAKVNNLSNEMMVVLVDDEIQEISLDTCGLFQLYFYKNLFDPDENSKILNDEHLTKKSCRNAVERNIFDKQKRKRT